MSDWQGFSPLNDFTGPLLDNLKRHPNRIVFPEGEDVRVLRVSQRFVEEQAGAPILLGLSLIHILMFGTRQHQEQQPAEQHQASCRRQGGGQRNALIDVYKRQAQMFCSPP